MSQINNLNSSQINFILIFFHNVVNELYEKGCRIYKFNLICFYHY